MVNSSVGRFNVIRRLIIAIMVFGFIGFFGFKLLPKSLEYITIFYVLIFVVILFLLISKFYRCPYCNSIPRGHPIPYVDLAPESCKVCGRSLRVDDQGDSSGRA